MKNDNKIDLINEEPCLKKSSNDSDLINNALEQYLASLSLPALNEKSLITELDKRVNNRSKAKRSISFLAFFNSMSNSGSMINPILNYISVFLITFITTTMPAGQNSENTNFSSKNEITKKQESTKIDSKKIIANPIESKISDKDEEIIIPEKKIIINQFENSDFTLKEYNSIGISQEKSERIFNINNFEKSSKPGIFYEFRTNRFKNLTNNNASAVQEALLKDFSIGLWYEINNNFSLGAEFRQETFNLLRGESVIGYNMNCWEISGRYISDLNLLNSRIYLQANLGAGSQGVIGRTSLGLQIPIVDGFNILTGFEFNSLFYSNKSKINNFNRIGLNLGFTFNMMN
jgi:hypothetical protein